MTGALIYPAPATGPVDMSTGQTSSPSYVCSFRISFVIDRLLAHLGDGSKNDNEFFNLCLSLARGIDYAVANSEVPDRAPDLPYLLKLVCQRRNDTLLHAAIMVLMISVKSACRNGWFNEKDNEELHILSNEIASSFCSVRDMNCDESTFSNNISAIMSRYYPRMKMGEMLSFVEATPGYGAYVKDFHISKKAKASPNEKIYLFVAQTDNTETSSCIISPQQANFLLNGKAVDRRTCVHKDPGPQIPTPVTHMLKYGTNLLQAVGQFNGKYIIAVAFMSMVSNSVCPTLPDYVPPAAAAPDSDNEIIEGPSRISLNCPISFRRINAPVKGHLCKHLQCFDFDNYVDINSRRPSWRCPHCSQSVCFHDIRIDQSMVKVLKEVGTNVSYVKISGDGSWEAVTETDDNTDKPAPSHQESTTFQDVGADILDLTEGENDMDLSISHQDNEIKPSPTQFQNRPNTNNPVPSFMNTNYVNRNTLPHMQDAFWREIQLPTFQNAISQGQSQLLASNNMHLQQHNNSDNEYGRYATQAGHVTRNPIAVQALPVQSSAGMNGVDRHLQFSRFHLNHPQVSCMTSAPPSQHMGSQNWGHHDRSHVSSQPVQQFSARLASPQQTNDYTYRYTSASLTDRFNSHPHQSLNQRVPHPVQSSAQWSPGVGPTTGSHYSMAAAQRPVQIKNWTPSVPAPVQTSEPSMPMVSTGEQRGPGPGSGQGPRVPDGSAGAPEDQNWRPAGRMRGSLSGRAYTDALRQSIIQPTQPVQAARPPVLNTPRPAVPSHLQSLMANRNAHGSQDGPGGSVLNG